MRVPTLRGRAVQPELLVLVSRQLRKPELHFSATPFCDMWQVVYESKRVPFNSKYGMDIGCPSIIAPSCVRTHSIPSLTRSLPPRTTASPLHSHLAPPLPSLHPPPPPPPPLVRRHQQPAPAASNPATTMDHNAPGQSHPPGFFPVQQQVVDLTASSSSMPPHPVNFVGYPGAQAFGPQYLAGVVGAADL